MNVLFLMKKNIPNNCIKFFLNTLTNLLAKININHYVYKLKSSYIYISEFNSYFILRENKLQKEYELKL